MKFAYRQQMSEHRMQTNNCFFFTLNVKVFALFDNRQRVNNDNSPNYRKI